MPHPTQMQASDTGLLVIDVQEKLIDKIHNYRDVVRNIEFLIDGARLLGLPIQATEQYPKGLGATVEPLRSKLPERPDKVAFSACAVPSVVEAFRRDARTKVVVAGIEAHVCVLGSVLDLLNLGFRVYVPVDAIGSRYPVDREFAMRRMDKAGAILTTAETCVFEWVGGSGHPKFKDLSKLVQERMKAMAG